MTLEAPIVVAIIRGLYTALGSAAFTGLTTYQVTGNGEDALLVAATAFLVALGFRGGVEGVIDQRRTRPVTAQEAAPALGDDDDDYHFGWRDGREHRGKTPAVCNICVIDNGG